MRWAFIICGFAGLFWTSYLDSLRGPLLPILSHELSINYRALSWVLVTTSLVSIVAAYLMGPLLKRVSEKKIALGISLIGVLTGIYSFFVHSFEGLILLAVFFGCIMAPASILANIFIIQGTDAKKRAQFLCALHTMYGLGSIFAPTAVAWTLRNQFPWNYSVLFSSLAFLALFLYECFALSEKKIEKVMEAPHAKKKLTKAEWGFAFYFAFYVVGEVICSMWLVTYLVEAMKLTPTAGAFYASIFFTCMVGTRMFCFFLVGPKAERFVLAGCLVFSIASYLVGRVFQIPMGFALLGCVGPFYPLFLARVSKAIPDRSDSFTVAAVTLMQIGVALSHYCMGQLTEQWGIANSYWFAVIFMGLVLLIIPVYFKWEISRVKSA